jgi:hypothetical protein
VTEIDLLGLRPTGWFARRPIPGLHAPRNDMTRVTGGTFLGTGIPIGPALTFGYIAT